MGSVNIEFSIAMIRAVTWTGLEWWTVWHCWEMRGSGDRVGQRLG